MPKSVRLVPNAKGVAELDRDLAIGVYALALAAETEAKREAPVRGGYRSFRPGIPPIGGTLRRSIHSIGYGRDGRQVGEHNEAGRAIPSEAGPQPGVISSYVGTNSGYGAFVELGTVKMPARPFLSPALDSAMARATSIMAAAIDRAGRPRARR